MCTVLGSRGRLILLPLCVLLCILLCETPCRDPLANTSQLGAGKVNMQFSEDARWAFRRSTPAHRGKNSLYIAIFLDNH